MSAAGWGTTNRALDLIRRGLAGVLRTGVRPAKLATNHDLMLWWFGDDSEDQQVERAFVLEDVLLQAVGRLGDGPAGRAAALLFGATPLSRGLPLKTRRRLAAEELEVLPSTLRKLQEPELIEDVMYELWRASDTSF